MRVEHTGHEVRSADAQAGTDFTGKRVHLIGIGGSGMCGAASMLVGLGAIVTGSDLQPFDGMGDLVSRGVAVSIGHGADRLHRDVDLVVISAAIPPGNPELTTAIARDVQIIQYAELLGELMTLREGVAIAGTHGKSSTTAMCAHVFREAGLEPSFIVGARSEQLRGSSAAGAGRHFIVESCEFNRSFLHLHPTSAAVLNVEPDHLDCYTDLDEIVEAFSCFCSNVHPDGLLICSAEDRWALKAAESAHARVLTFGFEEQADWRARNLTSDCGRFSFDVVFRGSHVLSTRLSVPGRYNVSNALATVGLAHESGVGPEVIARALAGYAGISRRLSFRGQGRGVVILDDYAHHPTEVRVTLEAARHRYLPKRMWVIFQPHQCSRTRHFLEEFAGSFDLADEVIVPDIFLAREECGEQARAGAQQLVSRITDRGGKATYLPSLGAITEYLEAGITEGDVVLTMGAGDVWKVADGLVERVCPVSGV